MDREQLLAHGFSSAAVDEYLAEKERLRVEFEANKIATARVAADRDLQTEADKREHEKNMLALRYDSMVEEGLLPAGLDLVAFQPEIQQTWDEHMRLVPTSNDNDLQANIDAATKGRTPTALPPRTDEEARAARFNVDFGARQ